jgi:hypothetical protein
MKRSDAAARACRQARRQSRNSPQVVRALFPAQCASAEEFVVQTRKAAH